MKYISFEDFTNKLSAKQFDIQAFVMSSTILPSVESHNEDKMVLSSGM